MRYRTHEDTSMPFGEHLEELRRRLIYALVGVVPIFIVALAFGQSMLEFLVRPVRAELRAQGLPDFLIATGPFETFATYVRVALVVTLLIGSPWLLWQLWLFVAPGLYDFERRFVYLLAPLSALLTVAGAAFMYLVMLRIVLAFFIAFGAGIGLRTAPTGPLPPGVTLPSVPVLDVDPEDPDPGSMWINAPEHELRFAVPRPGTEGPLVLGVPLTRGAGIAQQYRVSEYIKMVLGFALAFAVGFQMPVVVLLLCWADILRPEELAAKRKYVLFGTAAAAAILTPADPLSMLVLWLPLYLLFEAGLVMARLLPPERVARGLRLRRHDAAREPADAGDE